MRLRFILSETWTSLKRNVSMILSVTLVTFISFLFIGAAGLLQVQIAQAKGVWYDQVEVVVYLCPDGTSQAPSCASGKAPTDEEINDIIDVIDNELHNEVAKVTYISREQFYKDTFLKEYPNGEFNGRTLTPADMQASLRLKLKDPTKYQVVSEVLSGRDGIEQVEDQRQIFDPIFTIINRATMITVILAVVMVVTAVLLTGTTIRMSAASRRNETEIMRYVGASNWTIRLPFVLEGVIASLLGSLLAVGTLAGVVQVFVTDWLSQSVKWMPFVSVRTVLLLAPALVAGAVILSALASAVSLRRYLKA